MPEITRNFVPSFENFKSCIWLNGDISLEHEQVNSCAHDTSQLVPSSWKVCNAYPFHQNPTACNHSHANRRRYEHRKGPKWEQKQLLYGPWERFHELLGTGKDHHLGQRGRIQVHSELLPRSVNVRQLEGPLRRHQNLLRLLRHQKMVQVKDRVA